MPISVERKTGVPLYVQVKHQVERLVRNGVWEKGRKLPTERELAMALGVSRNTVSAAYRRLELEGLLVSRQGCGTFVSDRGERPARARERLERVVDAALDEALALGFEPGEFARMAVARAAEREEVLRHLRVCFVECNREQLDYFSKELELGSGVHILPLMMDDLRRGGEGVRAMLDGVDLVVTTFFHLEEVRGFLPGFDVVGIALDPQMDTIVRIARLPRTKAGLVCISTGFADRVLKSMANAGINHLEVDVTTTRDEAELRRFLAGVRVVVTSPGRRKEVERLSSPGTEIIEFIYTPDAGSIHLLKSVLIERREQRHRERGRRVAYIAG